METSSGDADVLEKLIGSSAVDINAYDSSGMTLLHHAAQHGYDDCIYILFKHGANIKQKTIVRPFFETSL